MKKIKVPKMRNINLWDELIYGAGGWDGSVGKGCLPPQMIRVQSLESHGRNGSKRADFYRLLFSFIQAPWYIHMYMHTHTICSMKIIQ